MKLKLLVKKKLNYVYNICISKVFEDIPWGQYHKKTRIVEIVYVFFTIMKLKLLIKKKTVHLIKIYFFQDNHLSDIS